LTYQTECQTNPPMANTQPTSYVQPLKAMI
jgi:hypothetical protein